MRRAPKTVWLSGVLLRFVVVYLPWLFVAMRVAALSAFAVAVLLFELLSFFLYLRARSDEDGPALFLLSYSGVGDIIWFLAAIALAILSGIMPGWGYAGMVLIWLGSAAVNFHVVRKLPLPKPGKLNAELTPGNGKKDAGLRRIDSFITVKLSAALIVTGLAGVIIGYILDRESWLLLSLSVLFLGLACGFSAQIRPLLMWRRQLVEGGK